MSNLKERLRLSFGDNSGDLYTQVEAGSPVIVEMGQRAKLITGALSRKKNPVELGTVCQDRTGIWVFEDRSGVRIFFIPSQNPVEPHATWSVNQPLREEYESIAASLLERYPNSGRLFYGTEARGDVEDRPKDSVLFGRDPGSIYESGLTDPHISMRHFGIGLERDGSLFVHDVSENGTFITIKATKEVFKPLKNRIIEPSKKLGEEISRRRLDSQRKKYEN